MSEQSTQTTDPSTQQQQQQPFYSGFQGADVKTWAESKGFKDPESLAVSTMNLEKLLGADRAGRTVILPKDDKDAEGLKAFRAKLGVPDTADGYQLPVPEGGDGAFAKTAASWFHEQGVPPAAARTIASKWNEHIAGAVKAAQEQEQAQSAQELEAVKTKWGQQFDANSEVARRYAKTSGLTGEQLSAVEAALGTATFLETFHKLGAALGEASFERGDGAPESAVEIDKQIDDLRQRRTEGKVGDMQFQAELNRLMMLKSNKRAA